MSDEPTLTLTTHAGQTVECAPHGEGYTVRTPSGEWWYPTAREAREAFHQLAREASWVSLESDRATRQMRAARAARGGQ